MTWRTASALPEAGAGLYVYGTATSPYVQQSGKFVEQGEIPC
jgi:hypothetical protein